MKPLVNSNSAIRAMFEEGRYLAAIHGAKNVYDFGLDNPDVPVPAEVNLTICDTLKEGEFAFIHGYMDNAGYEDVRQAVVESLNKRLGTRFRQNNTLMAVGAVSGLNVILKTLSSPGDEVIAFAPHSVEYSNYARNYDGDLMVISPGTADFEPNLVELEQKISARAKATIINAPNNPTGMVYSLETLTKMADIMRAKEEELGTAIVLLSGEPYGELAYDGVEVPYMTDVYNNTVICYSYNEFLSLPGECIGYLVIPDALKDNGGVFNAATVTDRMLGCVNAPSLMQGVIMRCLGAKVNLEAYDRNRSLLCNGLKNLGFECIRSQGAFYLFAESPKAGEKKSCGNYKKYNTLIVPRTSFAYSGYVWISYCVSHEQIKRSLSAFARTTAGYGLKE